MPDITILDHTIGTDRHRLGLPDPTPGPPSRIIMAALAVHQFGST